MGVVVPRHSVYPAAELDTRFLLQICMTALRCP